MPLINLSIRPLPQHYSDDAEKIFFSLDLTFLFDLRTGAAAAPVAPPPAPRLSAVGGAARGALWCSLGLLYAFSAGAFGCPDPGGRPPLPFPLPLPLPLPFPAPLPAVERPRPPGPGPAAAAVAAAAVAAAAADAAAADEASGASSPLPAWLPTLSRRRLNFRPSTTAFSNAGLLFWLLPGLFVASSFPVAACADEAAAEALPAVDPTVAAAPASP